MIEFQIYKVYISKLDHHGLINPYIHIDLQLYHRGTTFYTLLWKTQHFVGAEFKPIARFKVFRFEVK